LVWPPERPATSGVAPEEPPTGLLPIPRDHRFQDRAPSIGAVDIARAQGAAFQITELIEHEQRVVAGAAEWPLQGLPSCSPWVWR
jgi:hypothetical protein